MSASTSKLRVMLAPVILSLFFILFTAHSAASETNPAVTLCDFVIL